MINFKVVTVLNYRFKVTRPKQFAQHLL